MFLLLCMFFAHTANQFLWDNNNGNLICLAGPVKAPLLGSGFHTSVGKESRAQTLQSGEYLHHSHHKLNPHNVQSI